MDLETKEIAELSIDMATKAISENKVPPEIDAIMHLMSDKDESIYQLTALVAAHIASRMTMRISDI